MDDGRLGFFGQLRLILLLGLGRLVCFDLSLCSPLPLRLAFGQILLGIHLRRLLRLFGAYGSGAFALLPLEPLLLLEDLEVRPRARTSGIVIVVILLCK